MICTKCSNPIPDGAKFCPNCGASYMSAPDIMPSNTPAPEAEKKYFCEKCGLELAHGAKFCSVCGGAAKARDIPPIENSGNMFGEGTMTAVSLDKPSQSDGLVSAMNSAAANSFPSAPANNNGAVPPMGAPAPTYNNGAMPPMGAPAPAYNNGAAMSPMGTPAPAYNNGAAMSPMGTPAPAYNNGAAMSPMGAPAPSEGGFNSGFTAPAPAFAPSANAADAAFTSNMNTMPGYGTAAAAIKPIKKKHTGRTVALVIGIVLAVLLAAAAVLFFTNRAFVLSTLMGKNKYAAMVEGNSIKEVTEKMDMSSVSNGIKTSSSVMQSLSKTNILPDDLLGMTYNIYGRSAASSRMSSSGSQYMPALDLASLEKAYAEAIKSTYGKNSVSGSLKADITLGSSLKALLGDDLSEINEALSYINGTTFKYSVAGDEDTLAYSLGTDGKFTVDAKVIMDGQDMYIALPFVSDKAIKITLDKPVDMPTDMIKPLELDAKELERIIGDIVNIYLERYKALEIEMDNGDISAAGVTVGSKLISAEFGEQDLLDLAKEIAEYIANDEYLTNKMVEYVNNCGALITAGEYRSAITGIFKDAEAGKDSNNKLVIETAIDRNGNILGKSCTIVIDKQRVTFAYAENKNRTGAEIDISGVKLSVLNEKTDDSNGTCTFTVSAMGSSVISLVMDYSDMKQVDFGNQKITTGKFDITMKMPSTFDQMLDKSTLAAINGTKLSMTVSSENNSSFNTSMSLTVPGYIDASYSETLTAADDNSMLTAPSNVIDVTPLVKGGTLDDAAAADLTQLYKDLAKKFNEMGFADIDPDDIDELDPSVFTGKVSKSTVDGFLSAIGDLKDSITANAQNVGVDKVADLQKVYSKLEDLENKIRSRNYSITASDYENYVYEYEALKEEMAAVMNGGDLAHRWYGEENGSKAYFDFKNNKIEIDNLTAPIVWEDIGQGTISMTIIYNGESATQYFTYKLNGDTLTLTDTYGSSVDFTRVD